ncbi:DctP family TRAP transporter solute-binding subunit [Paenibacillus radicis (ex Xue et al. 2023)]|uniref:DctP family TRAP transporter solute-binding subunit n=1 Tax=Paenibacillus radicis (ex Xue et al. 2023) TaxID=2972489 RepID=A0ABT1YTP3_9BACL|nr:DctP family TRAP transporter solute-binding subunit [Paenibacillus radicis (ex Xue et al. 2023)]MCR8636559.1 DctP family TRAP transporter solute-binding subunit [Paenibacillus radicis (ex Xue et al. 2023)]
MKSFFSVAVIVVLGLAVAIVIGFYPSFMQAPVVYDDEQIGFDEQTVIKFSHVVAENTPKGLAAQEFARLVQEKTKGRVKVEVYPNSILYAEPDEIEALQKGNVQMIAPSFPNLSEVLPSWMVLDLPYAFLTQEAVQEAFEGKIGKLLFEQLNQVNMVGLAYWNSGFKQLTSNKGPILQPDDLKGQHLRTMRSTLLDAEFQLLGAKTTQMPFNLVYRGLESGAVDGEENSITNIYSKKFFKVQKYMTLTNHGYLGYAVLMNRSFWQKLSPEIQQQIQQAMKETTAWAYHNAIQMNDEQFEKIKQESQLQINSLTTEQLSEWMRAWEPIYPQYETVIGKELMDEIRRLRKKYMQ